MSVVAIAETSGSQGIEIGRELSRALGWEFADREIIAKAAERYGEAATELRHVTEEKPTLWERFSDSRRHYLSCVEATIFEMAAHGRVVLVGHGAAIMLRDVTHVLRVRVTAPEPVRVRRVRDQQGLADDDAAAHLVRDIDHERASRMRFLYHVDLDDPFLYDLMLNSERLTVDAGVRIIREALQSVAPSPQSLGRVNDLSLAAQARARLLVDPRLRRLRLAVSAVGGVLTVGGMVDAEELRDIALRTVGGITGVAGVTNEIVVMPRRFAGT
jgi:cytidylate kinase